MIPETNAASSPQTIADLIREAATSLPEDCARREAEMLMEHLLGVSRAWLFMHGSDPANTGLAESYHALVTRRVAGEPLAFIIGHTGFWTLTLKVTPDTLIPRVETELLVEAALARLPISEQLDVLDLGTGSGAIALALASERPKARVTAVDASAGALVVAKQNAITNEISQVSFLHGDWFEPLADRRFHLIATNPPYIADDDPHLSQGDLRFEPTTALSSGKDGLDDIRKIVREAPAHLYPNGWILIEHGYDQGEAVRELLNAAGFQKVETLQDLEQRERVSLGMLAT